MKVGKLLGVVMLISTVFVILLGCQKKEGPAEQAGKNVDQAAEKAGQEIDKAGQSIKNAVKK